MHHGFRDTLYLQPPLAIDPCMCHVDLIGIVKVWDRIGRVGDQIYAPPMLFVPVYLISIKIMAWKVRTIDRRVPKLHR